MNKEQVEKHGEVIEWFIHNYEKGVWCRRNDTGLQDWVLTSEPNWRSTYIYIQNDEYAEFRKALIDGKTIEYALPYCSQWNIVDNTIQHFSEAFKYRIQPEESQFKVGDWVYYSSENRIAQVMDYEDAEKSSIAITPYMAKNNRNVTKWVPQKNDWVIMYNSIIDKDEPHRVIRKFHTMSHDNTHYIDTYGDVWKIAEPLEAVYILNKG